MIDSDQYRLMDFGDGEKLEWIGGTVVRRQTPSVDLKQGKSGDVNWDAELQYRKQDGIGCWMGQPRRRWIVEHHQKRFLLKTTPAGQVGLFPEQMSNWNWIESLPGTMTGLKALNLFAYTGGTSLALASRGAEVVHVDASKSVVNWARENAAESQMADLPIRWIVEDAMKFVRREAKRKSKFDILVADPPSFGRGPRNETWKFDQDIVRLVEGLAEIAARELRVLLLTSHTPGFGPANLQRMVQQRFQLDPRGEEAMLELELKTQSGKRLRSGSCYRYFCE